jgi:hypothetical protein
LFKIPQIPLDIRVIFDVVPGNPGKVPSLSKGKGRRDKAIGQGVKWKSVPSKPYNEDLYLAE